MSDNQISGLNLFRDKINWKWVIGLLLIFRLVVIPTFLYLHEHSNKDSGQARNQAPCIDLLESPNGVDLPAKTGYWQLKLRPDKFSERIYFPKGVRFGTQYEGGRSCKVINRYGAIGTQYPNGTLWVISSKDDSFLKYKGNGFIKIWFAEVR